MALKIDLVNVFHNFKLIFYIKIATMSGYIKYLIPRRKSTQR